MPRETEPKKRNTTKKESPTHAFFNRSAEEVIVDLTERIYEPDTRSHDFARGNSKTIVVKNPQGETSFRITLAQKYSENDPNKTWKGSRLEKIRSLAPGEVIAFNFRASSLSFIKTAGGDNILIIELQDVDSGERTTSPTHVTKILGLHHIQEGRLTSMGRGLLRFQKLS
jgi:hypothetical protein